MSPSMRSLPRQPPFGIQRGFAAHAGCRYRLLVYRVGYVAGGENAFDARQRAVRLD